MHRPIVVDLLKGTSPWLPILVMVIATVGLSGLAWRLTGRRAFAPPTAYLVLGLASLALAQIATIAYLWAAVLGVMAIAGYVIAWPRASRGRGG